MLYIDKGSIFLWFRTGLYLANFSNVHFLPHVNTSITRKFTYGLKVY